MFKNIQGWFKKPLPKGLNKVISVLKVGVFVLLLVVVGLVILPLTTFSNKYQSLVVLSGSMEPAIKVGSLVFTSTVDPASLEEGDMVTFSRRGGMPTTHRIVEVKEDGSFAAQGDANKTRDKGAVLPSEVQGRVTFSIPFLGYAVNFAKTPQGLFILVILPAILIIIDELRNIKNETEKKYRGAQR